MARRATILPMAACAAPATAVETDWLEDADETQPD
jgi:hypothetical protein